jgi:hypothetical protein
MMTLFLLWLLFGVITEFILYKLCKLVDFPEFKLGLKVASVLLWPLIIYWFASGLKKGWKNAK